MSRDMQTTNRYEHSLDSAMRPVRPDGISRRTREHPWDAFLLQRRTAPAATWTPRPLRVSVKTSSETESVATRPLDFLSGVDLAEEHLGQLLDQSIA